MVRSASAPSLMIAGVRIPDEKILLSQCIDTSADSVCCITLQSFQVGDLVYVLNQERQKVADGKSVCCISREGMNRLHNQNVNHAFCDPLRRTGTELNLRDADYTLFQIVADPPRSDQPSAIE